MEAYVEKEEVKICKTCQHYEPLHRNAGFCTNSDILVEGINMGVLVRAVKSACSLYVNLAEAKNAVIFADSGAPVVTTAANSKNYQQLCFDMTGLTMN